MRGPIRRWRRPAPPVAAGVPLLQSAAADRFEFIFTAIAERVPVHDRASGPGRGISSTPSAFYVVLSDDSGACPAGTLPIYRFFNNRNDANMRHTRDLTVRREMLNKQWAPNGFGPNGVAFCSPA